MFETCVISHQPIFRLSPARVLLLSVTDGQSDITRITGVAESVFHLRKRPYIKYQNKVNHCQ